jgi:hypothetical protein
MKEKTITNAPTYRRAFQTAVWIDGGGFVQLKKVTGEIVNMESKPGKIIITGTNKRGKLTRETLDLSKIKFVKLNAK